MRLFLGLHEYIHFSCGSACTRLEPTLVPREGDEKPEGMKGTPGSTWLLGHVGAAVPLLRAFGTLWVTPGVQVPLEIITIP